MMLSAHFSREELQCKCGCGNIGGFVTNLKRLVNTLEVLRTLAGNKPVVITSGYRCPDHNDAVGGVKNSFHTQCLAADLYIPGISLCQIAKFAKQAGFMGVGKYPKQGFVHCDIGTKYLRTWTEYS